MKIGIWGAMLEEISAIKSLMTVQKKQPHVNSIIFTGVAGAVCEQLNIGDIVIGTGLYQHDMNATPFFEKFQVPLTRQILFKPQQTMVKKSVKAAKQFIKDAPKPLLNKHGVSTLTVH